MVNQPISHMLKDLENWLRNGTCTLAKCIDGGTLVCFSEKRTEGILYHQMVFESLPDDWRLFLKGKTKGTIVNEVYKILAIYDVWPDAITKKRAA